MKKTSVSPQRSSEDTISFKGDRFPPDIISYAVWLYDRFPLSLRRVEGSKKCGPPGMTARRYGAGATTWGEVPSVFRLPEASGYAATTVVC